MKKKLIVSVIAICVGLFFFKGSLSGDVADRLMLSGNFEIDDIVLSFRVPGLISERLVDEGSSVASGALLARLDDSEYRIAVERAAALLKADAAALRELELGARIEEKQQAQAQLQMAQATLRQFEAGSRPQERDAAKALLAQAEAMVRKADSALNEAARDEKQIAGLFAAGAVSEKENIAAKTRADAARANLNETIGRREAARQQLSMADEGARKEEIERARAAVNAASATLDLILAGPREERIQQARAKSEASAASLRQAQLSLGFSELHAPFDGTILTKSAQAGEFVKQGQPVLTIGNLNNLFLRVYVSEKKLGLVKIGQTVRITVDTYPDEVFDGKVVFISQEAEFTPKTVQTHEERVKLVYRVKISVNNPEQKLKPGMPADAVIGP